MNKLRPKRLIFKGVSILLDFYIIYFIWNNWEALGAKIFATIGISLFIVLTLLDVKEKEVEVE